MAGRILLEARVSVDITRDAQTFGAPAASRYPHQGSSSRSSRSRRAVVRRAEANAAKRSDPNPTTIHKQNKQVLIVFSGGRGLLLLLGVAKVTMKKASPLMMPSTSEVTRPEVHGSFVNACTTGTRIDIYIYTCIYELYLYITRGR